MSYKIGRTEDTPEIDQYLDYETAKRAAIAHSADGTAWRVWEVETGKLCCIALPAADSVSNGANAAIAETKANTTYQIGHLENVRDDDPVYDDLELAIEDAESNSYDDSTWGVWESETGELLYIVYQQERFKRD